MLLYFMLFALLGFVALGLFGFGWGVFIFSLSSFRFFFVSVWWVLCGLFLFLPFCGFFSLFLSLCLICRWGVGVVAYVRGVLGVLVYGLSWFVFWFFASVLFVALV